MTANASVAELVAPNTTIDGLVSTALLDDADYIAAPVPVVSTAILNISATNASASVLVSLSASSHIVMFSILASSPSEQLSVFSCIVDADLRKIVTVGMIHGLAIHLVRSKHAMLLAALAAILSRGRWHVGSI